MNSRRQILKLAGVAFAALALIAAPVYAGPDPQVFHPIRSTKELTALKPGTSMAVECPHCGTIAVTKAGKDDSHAKGFTCPECKMKFDFLDVAGGKAKAAHLVCVDAKGKQMPVKVCVAH